MTVSPRTIGGPVILILFGVLLSLLLAEGALRLGSLLVDRELATPSARSHKQRVLSLGDSNTYGVYVERSQAYPVVFEQLWNARRNGGGVEVFNLGYPGMNSSRLVNDFRRMLWTFNPDVVTVMAGANNLWTVPETAAASEHWSERLSAALWRSSRVYRFLYFAARGFEVRRLEIETPPERIAHGEGRARYGGEEFVLAWEGQTEGGIPGWDPKVALEADLRAMVTQSAEYGTTLVLLTYPAEASFYSWANAIIRDIAASTGTPLIDVAAALKPACPLPPEANVFSDAGARCPELFPDQHPTPFGHQRVAQVLVEGLERVLE